MRAVLALSIAFALCVVAAACGGSTDSVRSPGQSDAAATSAAGGGTDQSTVSSGDYFKNDGDGDADEHEKGPSTEDMQEMIVAGHTASSADRQAITSVVKRYYTAAAAGNGAAGCSLLDSSLASATTEDQSQVAPDIPKTCPAALSRLFKLQHQRFAAEQPSTMVITGVHVSGDAGLATLGFKRTVEGEIVLQREGLAWKIDALADSPLP